MIEQQTRRRSRRPACCLGCAALVVVLLVIAAVGWDRQKRAGVDEFAVTTPAVPKDNGYDDIVRAARMCGTLRNKGPLSAIPRPLPKEEAALAAGVAAEVPPVLAVLHDGLRKDCMRPPERSLAQITSLSGDQAAARELARVLTGAAQHHLAVGEYSKAADLLLDAQEVGAVMTRGGAVIDTLVGVAVAAIATRDFERAIPRMPAAELDRAAARLDRISERRWPLADVLMEERERTTVMGVATFRMTRSSLPSLLSLIVPSLNPANGLRAERTRLATFAKECRGPYAGTTRVGQPHPAWPGMEPKDLLQLRTKYLEWTARTTLLRTEVALYRYRAAHGTFPDTLQDLVPEHLKALPEDPFGGVAGVPMRYRAEAGGQRFRLYSVGPNMRDDGGVPIRHNSGQATVAIAGDIVAGDLLPKSTRATAPGRVPA